MDEKDLEAIGNLVDKKLDQKLKPLQEDLNGIKEDLTEIKETVDSHTVSLMNLEKDIKSYLEALDIESKRIDKHDERLEVIETSLGRKS